MRIPIDLMLPLPGPEGMLKLFLVLTFAVHILFVGLMLGGTLWSVIFRLLGQKDPFYDRLAWETLSTVTVNKSLAVVLGVAPLLLIGVTYTRYWYVATMVTFKAFMSIIWLVAVAFLFLYAYKYSWERFENRPLQHAPLGGVALAIFFLVPLIFLANVNLMLLPFKWDEVYGFVQAVLLANVLPRYLHFMVASLAMIGFFAAAYFWYRGRGSDDPFYRRARRIGLGWALAATLLQGVFGTLLFVTLPAGAYSNSLTVLICISLALVAVTCLALIRALQQESGAPIMAAFVLLGIVAILMSFQRHIVRENLLREPHQIAERRTQEYKTALASFMDSFTPEAEAAETGEVLFKQYCLSCHAQDRQLVGPSVAYMIDKYTGKQAEMTRFVLNPWKIDENLPMMPKPPINESQATRIVEYILSSTAEKPKEPAPGPEVKPKEEPVKEEKPAPPPEAKAKPDGEAIYKKYCTICHAYDRQLVGPPETYMIEKYKDKPEEMVKFVLNPYKVNPDWPAMPRQPVTEEEAESAVDYVLGKADK